MGIVAKNGILMLDHVETLRLQGNTTRRALVLSGRRRLRPVLMTSLATFLGLLPLALGSGAGANMLRPLAMAIPKLAVADRSGTAVVTVVKEGKAYEIPVQLGILVQDQVAVLSGIKAGETVVIEGGYALPDGYPVNVKE